MSHKSARKSQNAALTEDKEKKQTDSPVKEMKKKMAANAEKEKQAADKTEKTVKLPERTDKNVEKSDKPPEKTVNEKTDSKKTQNAEKVDKSVPTPDKNAQKADKAEKTDKSAEKTDKNSEKSDKKTDKVADKKDKPAEKKNETDKKEDGKGDASAKDKPEKPKQNGAANGESNGTGDTVSEPDSSEEELLVIDDQDELFPELTYDETSDVDFEEGAPSRSFTRRSQVKATKTPETPRPASVKEDDSKEKLLKMNDSLATDRKLRSADSPKRDSKKPAEAKNQDSPKKELIIVLTDDMPTQKEGTEKNIEKSDKSEDGKEKSRVDTGKNKLDLEVIDVDSLEGETRGRTRARVSPYTRSSASASASAPAPASAPTRHDLTTSSLTANYTGNNTTMEMDITETSSILEGSALDDSSSYLRGLRSIKGRGSYKPLRELTLTRTLHASNRTINSTLNTSLTESARPTGTVVGRKRKPDAEDSVEVAREAVDDEEASDAADQLHVHSKRMRLFDRFTVPFRGFNTRRASEIVGINTDLPLAAPVASTSSFDPETLKSSSDPIAVPLPPAPAHDKDSKRCILM